MSKISKNKAVLFLFLKVVAFVVILFFGYLQVRKIDTDSLQNLAVKNVFALILSVLLVFLNLFLEYFKWKNSLRNLSIRVSFKRKFASYMSGTLTGFLTPNLIGNFIGRLFYFKREQRISITFLTFLSNGAQLFVSLLLGLISILVIGLPNDLNLMPALLLQAIIVTLLIAMFVVYFKIFNISTAIFKRKQWMKRVLEEVKHKRQFLMQQFVLSLFRNLVFSFQYFLLLLAFGLKNDFMLILYIWQIYFWTTLIPSLFFGKLVIRESVALWIMIQVTDQVEIVLLSAIVLWFVNQAIPALIGIPYLHFTKKKKHA